MTIFDHKNNKVFGIAVDAGSGLKQALKDARKTFYQKNDLETFKKLIITSLGQYATTILIDSEFGPHLISRYPKQCSPMMAFEADVYHISDEDRITKLPDNIKVSDFSRLGYKVLKFFMYYAPNDNVEINEQKQKIIKRLGSLDYAYLKPLLVENATRTFSNPKFNINYLKVEVPVDLSFVEGFGDPIIKQKEAIKFFKDASTAASGIPLLYLSAGVSFEWFKASLNMAIKAEVDCSGFMCGRAIWSEAIKVFGEQGEEGLKSWLTTTGQNRLNELISLFNLTLYGHFSI